MTGSVSKQILKNKLKEKSQAEDEFSTETKELVEQRASVEGSTMTKVGQTSSGFTAMSSSCLLYTSPSPRDNRVSRMPSSA